MARCPRCAERSNVRAPKRHLVSLWPPQITVVDLETGAELGSFETEAEAAACLVFAGLRSDQVEFRSDAPLMTIAAAPWARTRSTRLHGPPAGTTHPLVQRTRWYSAPAGLARADTRLYECMNFQPPIPEAAMPLVTVKPRFQVTIPARLRKGIDLREGDIMEATIVGDGILFRPKQVVDREAAAGRIGAALAATGPSPEDAGRSEDEIMDDTITDIASSRRERRSRET